jgi:hypothetical protein
MMTELIVYACPLGPLAEQLAAYFAAAQRACGPNTAHQYMPHCTLTGFFHDTVASAAFYAQQLDIAIANYLPDRPTPPIRIIDLLLTPDFHGLQLESLWIRQVVAEFASRAAVSATRSDTLRLKDWLHLSLAYGFEPAHHEQLAALARQYVDITASVHWELRLYERHTDSSWTQHHACAI